MKSDTELVFGVTIRRRVEVLALYDTAATLDGPLQTDGERPRPLASIVFPSDQVEDAYLQDFFDCILKTSRGQPNRGPARDWSGIWLKQ